MTLVRCPGCHNMVARESVRCPVCGCKFTAAAIRYWTKWAIVVLCALWLLNRWVIRRFMPPAHPQHADMVVDALRSARSPTTPGSEVLRRPRFIRAG